MKLRVALLCLHSCPLGRLGTRDTGGMNVYVRETARELAALGMVVDIFTRCHSTCAVPDIALINGVRLIHLPVAGGEIKIGMYSYVPDLACAIHRFREAEGIDYDLIHSHYWLSGAVGTILSRWWKVPHVVALHTSARAKNDHLGWGAEAELRAQTEAEVLKTADLVIASCQHEREELVKHYEVPQDKIAVAPAGVDLTLFRPLPRMSSRQRLGLDSEAVVLFVGRVEFLKGLDVLLEAVGLMGKRDHIRLVIVGGEPGDDEEMERLYNMAKDYRIQSLVTFSGAVEQKELPIYYSAADVCVLPSRYETFGLVILESLACGTPVITTKVGCAWEVIRHGINGWLLDPLTPQRLRELLRMALSTPDKEKFRTAAQSSVSEFTWRATALKLAQQYRALVL